MCIGLRYLRKYTNCVPVNSKPYRTQFFPSEITLLPRLELESALSPNAGEGAHRYTTMHPCFGCAKEILQAQIEKVIYLHPWVPTNSDPAMDASMKAEYAKITAKTNIKQLKSLEDPVAAWAVTARRNAAGTEKTLPSSPA
jgi:hypothetical protein